MRIMRKLAFYISLVLLIAVLYILTVFYRTSSHQGNLLSNPMDINQKLHLEAVKSFTSSASDITENISLTTAMEVVYKDLSACPPRPQYLPEYKAHCWRGCNEGTKCIADIAGTQPDTRAKFCFPNLHLIGVKKSGTGDFSMKWIDRRPSISRVQQDYYPTATLCPVEFFQHQEMIIPFQHGHLYNGGPGNLMSHTVVSRNKTHLTILSAIQYLAYMATDDTRYYIQLRHPTLRVISCLFYWHIKSLLLTEMSVKDINGAFIDTLVRNLTEKMTKCQKKYSELACIYFVDSEDGAPDALITNSMYVVYIEEMFKFISRDKVMFRTTDEYSSHRAQTAREISEKHFGVPFPASLISREKQGIFNTVRGFRKSADIWPSTLRLLDEFFAPYNQRLAKLLGDDKWLFKVDITSQL